MSTACFELAHSIPMRLAELKVLIDKATFAENDDEPLYNAICRATCVLMASHLEGFLKDLTSSLLQDLNFYLGRFDKMPKAMQYEFCRKVAFFEGVPKDEVEHRISQLKAFFSKNTVNIDLKAFTYKENVNKNPSNDFIQSSMSKLGIPDVLNLIAVPAFEVVFDGDERTNLLLDRKLKSLVSSLYNFPFKELHGSFEIKKVGASKPKKAGSTLWHAFIEDMMNRRHAVAHGDSLNNDTTWEELRRDSSKLRVLMYGLIFSACSYLSRGVGTEAVV
jgi:hypothetical protein